MILKNISFVQSSIERYRQSNLDAKEMVKQLGDGDRTASSDQRLNRYTSLLAETGDPVRARTALERLLGGNDLTSINYLSRGLIASRAVCRVRLRNRAGDTVGFGTGFLVAPGVLMTNHHVISGASDAQGALAEFNYELDATGGETLPVSFEIITDPEPIALQRLDFCLACVSPRSRYKAKALDEFGWLPLYPASAKTFLGEYLTIIQHPGGERKQVCARENKLLRYDDAADSVWYNTDTVAGSSGSPVFNDSWHVVAIHHSGVPKTDGQGRWLTVDGRVWDQSMDESRIQWIANEGIRISRILEFLKAAHADHPLAAAVLQSPVPPQREKTLADDTTTGFQPSTSMNKGEMQVTVPVRISVRIGEPPAMAAGVPSASLTSPQLKTTTQRAGTDIVAVEKVEIDQSNYDERTGYRPRFLGDGGLQVPLPKVRDKELRTDVLTFTLNGKKSEELKYWNFTVVMNRRRKLAFYSAVNVDVNQRPANANREGDKWFFDSRIPESMQTGGDFYKEQKNFEARRDANPFDRGHLVRRMDATWGGTDTQAKRNGNDTFHWTNCAPQHWRYNQGAKKWLGLEDYIIDAFAGASGRACVINGPVFDGPPSRERADGRLTPDLEGRRRKDPTFGDLAIPKMFFKVVACARANKLAVAAFLMSQEEFLATIDRLKGRPQIPEEKLTTAEARLYQVSLAALARLTGLDFGPLVEADTGAEERLAMGGPRLIEHLSDIR